MQNRSAPSGPNQLLDIPFCASALQAAATPQTELFKSSPSPTLAGAGIVDTGSAYLGTGVTLSGRTQLKALTVRNRIKGTTGTNTTYTVSIDRVKSADMSVREHVALTAAGALTLTVDNLTTDEQRFPVPLSAGVTGVGFEDGDILVFKMAHLDLTAGGAAASTDIDVTVEMQTLPNATIFDDLS
jgi:hypothetical protein